MDAQALEAIRAHCRWPAEVTEVLTAQGQEVVLRAGRDLPAPHAPEEEVFFVLKGEVHALIDRGQGSERVARFGPGDLFSDAGMRSETLPVRCQAVVDTRLWKVSGDTFQSALSTSTRWAQSVQQSSRQRWLFSVRQRSPHRRTVQDFFLSHHFSLAANVRVLRRDLCLGCDACLEACGESHGEPRLSLEGPSLGRLLFPTLCQSCEGKPCLSACKLGHMQLTEGGEVQIDPFCIGCGACAKACPFQAIRVRELPFRADDFPNPVISVNASGENDLPGLFVLGTATGPRPGDALKAAERAVAALAQKHRPGRGPGCDVLIIGGGASGLAAAKACAAQALGFALYECRTFAKALADHPKRAALTAWIKDFSQGQAALHQEDRVLAVRRTSTGFRATTHSGSVESRALLYAAGTQSLELLTEMGVAPIAPHSAPMAEFAASLGVRKVAIKCDHCADLDHQACIAACPNRALINLDVADVFFEQRAEGGGTSDFSADAFLGGSPTPWRFARLAQAGLALSLMALAALGVECFLRRSLPEHSLLALWQRARGIDGPITFSSGDGLGHWLGYLGSGLMFLAVFYPLRSRAGLFRKAVSGGAWLSFHVWVGFFGASFVTFHSLLKLDRWAAIPTVAMWCVILTGAIGKYLFGGLRIAQAIADLRGARGEIESSAPSDEPSVPGGAIASVGTMLWHDLRLRLRFFAWRFLGWHKAKGDEARRDEARLFAAQLVNERSNVALSVLQGLLRYWNRLHLILTVAMWILAVAHIVVSLLYKAS
jgi:Fe-S-cluster-containing hydrogenase component 2/CRP-like cAMP-binding protein